MGVQLSQVKERPSEWGVEPVPQGVAWLEAADPTAVLALERLWVKLHIVEDKVMAVESAGVSSFVAVHPN